MIPRLLFEAGPERYVVGEGGEDGFAVFSLRGGKEHAVRLEAAHFAGRKIGDDDDAATDEVFRGVPLGYARKDLASGKVGAEVYFEAQELVGFRDALSDDDLSYAKLDFYEVVDGDLRG